MIERGIQPSAGAVARSAGLREIRGDVVGVGGSLEVLEVAGHASVAGQVVVVVDVTVGAGARGNGVQAGKREPGAVVIERGIEPGAGAVAVGTGLREIRGDVVGIGGSLEVLQVACGAGRAGQVVVIVDVAISASTRRHGMHAGERKAGAVVVEFRVHPVAGAVTLLAGLGEIRGDVVGIGGSLEVL